MMENKHLLEIIFKLNIERKVFFEILPEQYFEGWWSWQKAA